MGATGPAVRGHDNGGLVIGSGIPGLRGGGHGPPVVLHGLGITRVNLKMVVNLGYQVVKVV